MLRPALRDLRLSLDPLLLKRFSLLPFPLLDYPQPRKTSGEGHHDDQNGVLDHWNCPELMFADQCFASLSHLPLIHIKSYSPFTILTGSLRSITAERAQISSRCRKSPANSQRLAPPTAHSPAAPPSATSLNRLNSNRSHHPRHSNPHSPRRATLVPLPRFPPLEVCGRRPPWATRHRHGVGIRKPSQTQTSMCPSVRSDLPP